MWKVGKLLVQPAERIHENIASFLRWLWLLVHYKNLTDTVCSVGTWLMNVSHWHVCRRQSGSVFVCSVVRCKKLVDKFIFLADKHELKRIYVLYMTLIICVNQRVETIQIVTVQNQHVKDSLNTFHTKKHTFCLPACLPACVVLLCFTLWLSFHVHIHLCWCCSSSLLE